jgi:hypothetical protein
MDKDITPLELIEDPEVFHPELLPRKGEMIAWGLTLLVGAAWLILVWQGLKINLALPILAVILFLSALSVSLGNWMDRNTVLQLGREGVKYQNGLRRVRLSWDEVEQVRINPSQWGKKIHVIGPQSYFSFRTLGEVKVQGEIKGRMGFTDGETILKQILAYSALKVKGKSAQGYYYGRD